MKFKNDFRIFPTWEAGLAIAISLFWLFTQNACAGIPAGGGMAKARDKQAASHLLHFAPGKAPPGMRGPLFAGASAPGSFHIPRIGAVTGTHLAAVDGLDAEDDWAGFIGVSTLPLLSPPVSGKCKFVMDTHNARQNCEAGDPNICSEIHVPPQFSRIVLNSGFILIDGMEYFIRQGHPSGSTIEELLPVVIDLVSTSRIIKFSHSQLCGVYHIKFIE